MCNILILKLYIKNMNKILIATYTCMIAFTLSKDVLASSDKTNKKAQDVICDPV